jgi:hypothetical protein
MTSQCIALTGVGYNRCETHGLDGSDFCAEHQEYSFANWWTQSFNYIQMGGPKLKTFSDERASLIKTTINKGYVSFDDPSFHIYMRWINSLSILTPLVRIRQLNFLLENWPGQVNLLRWPTAIKKLVTSPGIDTCGLPSYSLVLMAKESTMVRLYSLVFRHLINDIGPAHTYMYLLLCAQASRFDTTTFLKCVQPPPELAFLPDALETLDAEILQRAKKGLRQRMNAIKEELIAVTCAPKRVMDWVMDHEERKEMLD